MGLSRLCSSPPGVGLEAINATCASERAASLKPSNLAGRCNAHASLQWLTPKMPVKVGHLENMRGKKHWTTILFVALLGILFGACQKLAICCAAKRWWFSGLAINNSFTASLEEPAKRKPNAKQAPAGGCEHGVLRWIKNSIVQKIHVSVVHLWWSSHDFYHYCWFIRPIFVGI